MGRLQQKISNLEDQASTLQKSAERSATALEALKGSDYVAAGDFLIKLKGSSDVNNLVKRLGDVETNVSNVRSDLANKVSQNKAYRIKSQLPPGDSPGDWYASVQNYGNVGLQPSLSIQINKLKTKDTEDQDWVFVAK